MNITMPTFNLRKGAASLFNLTKSKKNTRTNSIYTLDAYRDNGMWVFDDDAVGLVKEPFVAGADIVFDHMAERHLDGTRDRVSVAFSTTPIPDYDVSATITGADGYNGHYYKVTKFVGDDDMVGFPFWLCPALLLYYTNAPQDIYIKITSNA